MCRIGLLVFRHVKRSVLAFPVALVLAVAGCSTSSDDSAASAQSASVVTSTTAEPTEVELKIGDTVLFGRDPVGSATLLSMEINPECEYSSYDPEGSDAKRGRTTHVALEFSIEASPDGNFINIPSLSISERDKDGYTANTLAHSDDTSYCLDFDERLSTVDAGEKVRGWVLLAAEEPEGEFVWNLQRDGKKVVIPFSTSNPNTATASPPSSVDLPAPRQVNYQELADKLTEIGDEPFPITAQEAEETAGMICGILELDPEQDGAVDRMIDEIVESEDVPREIAARMINLLVEYECPGVGA